MFSARKSNIESGEDMAAYDSLMVFTGNANPEIGATCCQTFGYFTRRSHRFQIHQMEK